MRVVAAWGCAVAIAAAGLVPAYGAPEGTTVPRGGYSVTAKANRTDLVLGQAVTISGTVSPGAKGQQVVLQKRYGKKKPWVVERRATIGGDGGYRVSDRPTSLKKRWYRVVKPAHGSHGTGISHPITVRVYRPSYLTDRDSVHSSGVYDDTVTINGKRYKKSFRGYVCDGCSDDYVEYNLSRKCRTLTAVLGITDDSETGARAEFEVLGDGSRLFDRTFGLGETQKVSLDVRHVLRVRFEFSDAGTDEEAIPAAGSPRVLCSG